MINVDVIGNEKVANLYISNVTIGNSSSNSDSLLTGEIEFKWFNALQSKDKPYFDYFNNRYPLQIRVVEFYDKAAFTEYMSQRTSNNRLAFLKELAFQNVAKVQTISVPINKPGMRDLRKDVLTPGFIKHKFSVKGGIENYYICANFVVRTRRKQKEGPLAVERIIENKKIITDSYVYKIKGKNQIWTGPVHEHDGQPMAGSFHTFAPHPMLEKVMVSNFKLKDYRPLEEQSVLDTSISNRQIGNINFFSQVRHCQTENKKLNLMFSINTKEMILKGSKYSSLLKNFDEKAFDLMVSNINIKEISIFMKNSSEPFKPVITSRQQGQLLRTAYSYRDTILQNTQETFTFSGQENLHSVLQEIAFSKDTNIRTFMCQIDEREVSTIKVIADIDDPCENFLYGLLENFKLNKKNLQTYDFLLKKREAYDRETKRFNQRFLADEYDGQLQFWYRPIEAYLKMLSMTRNLSDEQIKDEVMRVFYYMAPRSCTPSSVSIFMDKYKQALALFTKRFELRSSNIGSESFSGASSPTVRRNKFEIEYDIYHDYNNKFYSSIGVLSELNLVPTISVTGFREILETEARKFNNPEIIYDSQQTVASAEILNSANSGLYDKFYLSPTRLYNLTSEFKFENIKNITESELAEFNNKNILDGLDLKSLFGKSVSVNIYEEEENADNVPNVLGQNSDFQATGSEYVRQQNNLSIPKNIGRAFGRQSTNNHSIIQKLDLSTPNNIFSSKSQKTAERVPMQIKFLSNKQQVINAFESIQKLMNDNPHIKDLAFFNLQKVLYEIGYETDSSNKEIIGKPIVAEMNGNILDRLSSPVICHLVRYEEDSLENKDNSFDDYSIANNFFILVPDNYKFVKQSEAAIIRERHSESLSTCYDKYVSSSIFEGEFLRTFDSIEPLDRTDQMPAVSPTNKKTSSLAKKTGRSGMGKEFIGPKDKHEKEDEKIEVMLGKTKTSDNKTIGELMGSKKTKPKQNRMESGKKDEQEDRKERREQRKENRKNQEKLGQRNEQRRNTRSNQQTTTRSTSRPRGTSSPRGTSGRSGTGIGSGRGSGRGSMGSGRGSGGGRSGY